jgi:ferredoxin-NADP reductase
MMQLIVVNRCQIAEDVVELTLRDADGGRLPEWTPGAHIDLCVGPGTVRQYSLCGPPDDPASYRIAVLREDDGRGGSRAVHDNLHAGSVVQVGGPRNNFALEPAGAYLFIAGGIGITPIIPMVEHATKSGARWRLLYGGRRRSSMAYVAELERLGDVTVCPQDRDGLLNLPAEICRCTSGELVYCCGPEPLLAAVEDCCARSGMQRSLRLERFSPKTNGSPRSDAANHDFVVELGDSGQAMEIPADRSILEVLRDAGIDVLSSCEEGTCGSCELPVLSGTPDHRDCVLSEEEQAACDRMMICVSRSRSARLRLDIELVDGAPVTTRERICG